MCWRTRPPLTCNFHQNNFRQLKRGNAFHLHHGDWADWHRQKARTTLRCHERSIIHSHAMYQNILRKIKGAYAESLRVRAIFCLFFLSLINSQFLGETNIHCDFHSWRLFLRSETNLSLLREVKSCSLHPYLFPDRLSKSQLFIKSIALRYVKQQFCLWAPALR